MKKQYFVIALLLFIFVAKIAVDQVSDNRNLVENKELASSEVLSEKVQKQSEIQVSETSKVSDAPEETEVVSEPGVSGNGSTGISLPNNEPFDINDPHDKYGEPLKILETNEFHDALDWNDINSMTVDAETGEPCNNFINDLETNGKASIVLSPDNDPKSVFCSQTIGESDESDGIPDLPVGDFSDVYINSAIYYVSIVPLDGDKYITLMYRQSPLEGDDGLEFFADLTTIDMRDYFEPQKFYKEVENAELPENGHTDVFVDDYLYSQYMYDLGSPIEWYTRQYEQDTSMADYDLYTKFTPTEVDAGLEIVDYDTYMTCLNELQENLIENYVDY